MANPPHVKLGGRCGYASRTIPARRRRDISQTIGEWVSQGRCDALLLPARRSHQHGQSLDQSGLGYRLRICPALCARPASPSVYSGQHGHRGMLAFCQTLSSCRGHCTMAVANALCQLLQPAYCRGHVPCRPGHSVMLVRAVDLWSVTATRRSLLRWGTRLFSPQSHVTSRRRRSSPVLHAVRNTFALR